MRLMFADGVLACFEGVGGDRFVVFIAECRMSDHLLLLYIN